MTSLQANAVYSHELTFSAVHLSDKMRAILRQMTDIGHQHEPDWQRWAVGQRCPV